MPCGHAAWKACNGFMYRLQIVFLPRSHSAQLCRQLFLCSDFRKSLLHPSRRSRGWSQVVLHMNADDAAAAGKDIPHVSHLQQLRGHFTDGEGRKLYRGTSMYRFFSSFWTLLQYFIHEVHWCNIGVMRRENLIKNSQNTAVLSSLSYEQKKLFNSVRWRKMINRGRLRSPRIVLFWQHQKLQTNPHLS